VPRLPFRITLFLSSYVPLFGVLAWTNRRDCTTLLVLSGVAALSVLGLVIVLFVKRSDTGPRLEAAHVKPKDGDVLAYMATYLVPFLGVDLATVDGVVVFGVFMGVLGLVYVNSDMLFVNPLLVAIGYHTYEITDPDGHSYSLITRRRDIGPGTVIRPASAGRYIRIEVRQRERK
jgi:hypothetical protein